MYLNGIVIQKYVSNSYKGIDGSGWSENTGCNWYFNEDEQLSEFYEPFYDEYIGMTYRNLNKRSWVAACNDMEYINKYVEESRKRGIPYRLLLCESEIPNPIMSVSELEKKFLGYDYAYATGDNYSAVYNEIPFVFPQFRLNCNVEEGDFIIFRLHEVYLSMFSRHSGHGF